MKARANESVIQRKGGAGWWGFSGNDVATVFAAAQSMFGVTVAQVRAVFRGQRATVPVWMDPLAKRSQNKAA